MFSQRHSCDRCRQQKVRCLKIGELHAAVGGGGDRLATCERCAKADLPCVYSLKPKNRRASQPPNTEANATSPMRSVRFNHDLTDMLSRNDGSGTGLGDMAIPLFDIGETTVPGFNDGEEYDWNNNASLSSMLSVANGALGDIPAVFQNHSKDTVDALTRQAMALSNRATRATRQLDQGASEAPLTVTSPVVNEVFEAANALVRIIEGIMMQKSTSASSEYLPRDKDEPQPTFDSGLVFLVFATHQHLLSLFGAICGSIQRSLGLMALGSDQRQQALYGDGTSSAQFVMILQLIIHLTNRLGRSLRLESGSAAGSRADGHMTGIALLPPHELTPQLEGGEESSGSPGIVDLAQDMLRKLPNEHVKLRQLVQELQARME